MLGLQRVLRFMLQGRINKSMIYTIKLTEEQKQIICLAMEKYSQLHLGQTRDQFELAKRISAVLNKPCNSTTLDITTNV